MNIKIILISFLAIISFDVFSQSNEQKDSLGSKMVGIHLKKLIDDADSLNKLNAQLKSKLDSLTSVKIDSKFDENGFLKILKQFSIILPISLLLFGGIIILSILFFLYKVEKGFGNYAFQIIGLIIVIIAGLFLIVTGYDKDQITPIVGLLGTIVGFIFGSNLNNRSDVNNRSDDLNKNKP